MSTLLHVCSVKQVCAHVTSKFGQKPGKGDRDAGRRLNSSRIIKGSACQICSGKEAACGKLSEGPIYIDNIYIIPCLSSQMDRPRRLP